MNACTVRWSVFAYLTPLLSPSFSCDLRETMSSVVLTDVDVQGVARPSCVREQLWVRSPLPCCNFDLLCSSLLILVHCTLMNLCPRGEVSTDYELETVYRVAIPQVLEKIVKLRSSLYSVRVLTYYVDGQLSSIKQITQATGDLQAI